MVYLEAWLPFILSEHVQISAFKLYNLLYTTCVDFRAKWECKADSNEGYEGDEEARQDLLRRAYELGADYIDVEFKVWCRLFIWKN